MTRPIPARLIADLADQVLGHAGRIRLEVRGESMRPALLDGDQITVEAAESTSLWPGALVALRTPDGMMVHRLVRTLSDGRLLTAGDAVDHRDRPAAPADLLGVVVSVERDGHEFSPPSGRLDLWRSEARRLPAALRRRFASTSPYRSSTR